MGFSCPLCREFVPAPADIGKPATWAEGLPVCKILDKLSRSRESNLCAACQRENEEEEEQTEEQEEMEIDIDNSLLKMIQRQEELKEAREL